MKLIKKVASDACIVICSPHFWFRNYLTSPTLTKFIEKEIGSGAKVEVIDQYTMRLGGVTLWRENYPYAYGRVWEGGGEESLRLPSRAAAVLLRKAEVAATNRSEEIISQLIGQKSHG